jgi:uncharacterized membrane protein
MKYFIALILLASSAAYANRCDYPWETDSRGHICGGRAASER